jgi:hypothetical protein
MIISHRDSAPQRGKSAHRPGGIAFIALLRGDTGSIDNFDLSISITTEDFFTPRHRHNFDQLRYILEGEFSFDRGRVQGTGQISYFGEGTYYEQRGIGRTETLLLQSAGASGDGYMSFEQLYQTAEALTKTGRFEDGVYSWVDGKGTKHNVDGYQAVWERVNGRKLTYPRPRYDGPVILNPDNFAWLSVSQVPGAGVRDLGRFHERGLSVSQFQLPAGCRIELTGSAGRTLLFVEEGEGEVNGQPLLRHSAVRIESGETGPIQATKSMRLLRMDLPNFRQPMVA